MTIRELYQNIGGDYDQAMRILPMEKLIDKHLRRFPQNGVVDELLAAGESMEPARLFEAAHAVKGVCANLGLTNLSEAASEVTEEFRPGRERTLTDEELKARIDSIRVMYERVKEGIKEYEESGS
jgi:HPt (histidine-containing phosphotransfer) domain-containing protein